MTFKIMATRGLIKMAVLCLISASILQGCTNTESITKTSSKPIPKNQMSSSTDITPPSPIEIMPFFDNGKYPEIDTSGLPRIGINTPNGIRYIPDQTKNPVLIKAIETMDSIRIQYEKIDPNYYHRKEWRDVANLSTRIVNIHYHDIIRLGCQDYVDAMCRASGLRYVSDCGPEHMFGSSAQSECEKKSIQSTPVNLVHRMSCSINGSIHKPEILGQHALPISERIKNRLLFECTVWKTE